MGIMISSMEDYNRAKKERELDPFADKAEGYESAEIDKSRSRTDKIFHVEKKQEEAPKKPKIELMEFQKKRLMVVGIVVCVLASLGIFYAVFRERIDAAIFGNEGKSVEMKQRGQQGCVLSDVAEEANTILSETGVYAMIRYYDEQIEKQSAKATKAALLQQRAEALVTYMKENKDVDLADQALADVLEADELLRTSDSALAVVVIARDLGREETRVEYVEVARSRGFIDDTESYE